MSIGNETVMGFLDCAWRSDPFLCDGDQLKKVLLKSNAANADEVANAF